MAVIRHFEAAPEERAAYLKMRRAMAGVTEEAEPDEEDDGRGRFDQPAERYAEMSAAENLILTITASGFGKLIVLARLPGARPRRPGRRRRWTGRCAAAADRLLASRWSSAIR